MVPRIQAPTIADQRNMRQRQLISAAMSLALEGGAEAVTVSAVAKRAGISRSSIYEYFSSSADLIADLILEEMDYYRNRLLNAVASVDDPYIYIELWIVEALQYIIDGRHLLVKSFNTVSPPNYRKSEIAQGHKNLMSTIIRPLEEIGLPDIAMGLAFLQNTIEAASVRIESGGEPMFEIASARKYAIGGLRALTE